MTTTCGTQCTHLQHCGTLGRTRKNRHPKLATIVCSRVRCEGEKEDSPPEFKCLYGVPPCLVPSSSFPPLLMLWAHRQKPCPYNIAPDHSSCLCTQGPSGFEYLTGAVALNYGEEFWFLLQSRRASKGGAVAFGT